MQTGTADDADPFWVAVIDENIPVDASFILMDVLELVPHPNASARGIYHRIPNQILSVPVNTIVTKVCSLKK